MANPGADGKGKLDVNAEIAEVERRMAVHRDRLKRHAGEAAAVAKRKARPLPIVGLVALAGIGFAVARLTRSSGRWRAAAWRPDRYDGRHYVPPPRTSYDQGWRDSERERRTVSRLGKLAAVTGAAVRFGMSPQARFLWNAVQRRRDRY